jgi:hypothetical protein
MRIVGITCAVFAFFMIIMLVIIYGLIDLLPKV